jgi:hypothetical protein
VGTGGGLRELPTPSPGLSLVTNESGQVTFSSGSVKGCGEWCFEVTDVAHATLNYNNGANNNVTQSCESGDVF